MVFPRTFVTRLLLRSVIPFDTSACDRFRNRPGSKFTLQNSGLDELDGRRLPAVLRVRSG